MKKPRGRPNLGKTETIRQRAINVYLPTEEMIERWKSEAERFGVPLSRFIVETVDDSIRKNPAGITPREELEKELNDAKAEVKQLSARLEPLEEALKRADVTIADYRSKLTEPVLPSADAELTSRLIELFLAEMVLNIDEVPETLGIKLTSSKDVARLQSSVDLLKKAGLVESGMFEWRWTGGAKRKPRISPERRRGLKRVH
ncbi:MAG: hypothetical protein KKE24_09345 [Candidatus Thermoplasmatota archaeon]|nr:hypothetical protein [Candidatus Thermoplasmatota archaeon]